MSYDIFIQKDKTISRNDLAEAVKKLNKEYKDKNIKINKIVGSQTAFNCFFNQVNRTSLSLQKDKIILSTNPKNGLYADWVAAKLAKILDGHLFDPQNMKKLSEKDVNEIFEKFNKQNLLEKKPKKERVSHYYVSKRKKESDVLKKLSEKKLVDNLVETVREFFSHYTEEYKLSEIIAKQNIGAFGITAHLKEDRKKYVMINRFKRKTGNGDESRVFITAKGKTNNLAKKLIEKLSSEYDMDFKEEKE